MGVIAQLPCCVGHFTGTQCEGRIEVHHVAESSSKRSAFATVPLCEAHHRGPAGLHVMGAKAFCALYRPPFENEYGLLAWTAELLERVLYQHGRRAA